MRSENRSSALTARRSPQWPGSHAPLLGSPQDPPGGSPLSVPTHLLLTPSARSCPPRIASHSTPTPPPPAPASTTGRTRRQPPGPPHARRRDRPPAPPSVSPRSSRPPPPPVASCPPHRARFPDQA